MTYLPSEFINPNYKYMVQDGIIRVITNNNCYQNYNTEYCECYDVYISNDYLVSNKTTCNYNPNIYVTSDQFTDNFYYRIDFDKILIIFFIMSIFIVFIPLKILSRLFGRWLRV